MAEDQGVNGNIWNDEVSILLKEIGWDKVGDSNIDIKDVTNLIHGIDSIFKYVSPLSENLEKGIIVEAKYYKTTSFHFPYLQKWISQLEKKISKLKFDGKIKETFPSLINSDNKTGVIVIWFYDYENYSSDDFFIKLSNFRFPLSNASEISSRIFVLENSRILKLCSLLKTKSEWESEHMGIIRFYYPYSEQFRNRINRSNVLTIENLFSSFILAEGKYGDKLIRLCFYFGDLNSNSFHTLKNVLYSLSFIDAEIPLKLYVYNRDVEFRKIRPDIVKYFDENEFEIESMDIFADIPGRFKK